MADQTTIDMLINVLEGTELFPGEDGVVYARFELNGDRVIHPTGSSTFHMWFNRQALELGLPMPSRRAVAQALAEIEYKTHSIDHAHPVCGRFYSDAESIYINLGADKVLEISSSGHEIVDELWPVFPTRAGMLDLPVPEHGVALDVLPKLLALDERQTFLVLAWLMALLQPECRLPVLIITGPPNCGKTRLAAAVRHLLDPANVAILPFPKSPAELEEAAADNAILVFDKIQALPRWFNQGILALAEGTSMRHQKTNTTIQRKVPTILVCDELPQAGDLADDAIILRLKERPPSKLKTNAALVQDLHCGHAQALGAIVDVVVKALTCTPSVALTAVYKDAALERWLLAVDKALELQGKLWAAYRENGEMALSDIVNSNPPVQAFLALLHTQRTVTATATEMLSLIEPLLVQSKGARWPKSGKEFAAVLRRYAYAMPNVEIEFDVRTGKGRDRNIVATLKVDEIQRETALAKPVKRTKASSKVEIAEAQASLL